MESERPVLEKKKDQLKELQQQYFDGDRRRILRVSMKINQNVSKAILTCHQSEKTTKTSTIIYAFKTNIISHKIIGLSGFGLLIVLLGGGTYTLVPFVDKKKNTTNLVRQVLKTRLKTVV